MSTCQAKFAPSSHVSHAEDNDPPWCDSSLASSHALHCGCPLGPTCPFVTYAPPPLSWLQVAGTKHTAFSKHSELEYPSSNAINARVHYCSISAMPQYSTKSPEELRCEDYEGCTSGPGQQGPWGPPAAAAGTAGQGFGFGSASFGYNPASGAVPQVRCVTSCAAVRHRRADMMCVYWAGLQLPVVPSWCMSEVLAGT
jgi:hypothetical protein